MSRDERRFGETSPFSVQDVVGLVVFVIGFSLLVLLKWLREHIGGVSLAGIGLSLCTAGVALLTIRIRAH